MSSGWIIFGELAVVFGVALVFGVKEMRNLRRFNRERDARFAESQAEKARSTDNRS